MLPVCRPLLAAVLLSTAMGSAAVAQRVPTPPVAPIAPGGPHFTGTVLIAGLPADPGVVVQVVVFRAGMKFKVCAEGEVKVQTLGLTRPPPLPRHTGYDAALDATPECLNPDNTYAFYVNGVYATGSMKYRFRRPPRWPAPT